nr:GNAT family N-acetyltransferase [Caballeronia insecticola]
MPDQHPLDRVVWRALSSTQNAIALGDYRAWRYAPSMTAFGAMPDSSAGSFDALRALIEASGPVALVETNEVFAPAGISVVRRGTLLQMVWEGASHEPRKSRALQHVTLGQADVPDMLALAAATQPGPFGPRTVELGRYLGMRESGKLVAMAGERMRLDGYTEISAVCVDESARGRGYAAGLMNALIDSIAARGEKPFLHVFTSNRTAIGLYRALGFVERRMLHLTVLGPQA